jgi:hypothetical protein
MHSLDIPQAEDPGFPSQRQRMPKQLSPDEILSLIIGDTAEIRGILDILVTDLVTPAFQGYLVNVMKFAICVIRDAPGLNLNEAFP